MSNNKPRSIIRLKRIKAFSYEIVRIEASISLLGHNLSLIVDSFFDCH